MTGQPRIYHVAVPNPDGEGTHRIACYEWGDRQNSKVVICIHGLTRNSRDFDFLARSLASDYRVIAMDMPGRGKSDPLARKEWYQNGVYAQDVLAVFHHLSLQKVQWVGTSMGGLIGMIIASIPQSPITRMVLNDIGAAIPVSGLKRIAEYVRLPLTFAHRDEITQHLRSILKPFGISDEEAFQHLVEHGIETTEEGRYRLNYHPAIGESFADAFLHAEDETAEINIWPIWEMVPCPVLLLRGQKSDIFPLPVAKRMMHNRPDTELIEFPDVGHAPSLTDEAQISVIRQWLDKN
jgi:pimeloyl-ACP methyl ester carboxylesterase